MTVATLPGQRVAQAPLSYRKNVKMLRGPQVATLRSAYRASMGIGDDRGWQHWAGIHGLPLPELSRADLTFYGLDHSGPSYQVRVFFNNPDAGPDTPLSRAKNSPARSRYSLTAAASGRKDTATSGSRSARSTGARRPQLVPITRALTVTGAVRDLIHREMSSVTVTAVPVGPPIRAGHRGPGRRRPDRRSGRPAHLRIARTWRAPKDAQPEVPARRDARGRPRCPAAAAAAAGRGDLRERPPDGRAPGGGRLPSDGPGRARSSPAPAEPRHLPSDAIGAFEA